MALDQEGISEIETVEPATAGRDSAGAWLGTGAALLSLAALAPAGWLAYSAFGIDHGAPLPPALKAQRIEFDSGAGRLSYYVDREAWGTPLVLVHSVNAAASSYEMRPIFEHYRRVRPVFCLDLPGYGFSERSKRDYRPELFTRAILDLIRTQVGQPADVVALSLGGEFAAQAALERPQIIRSLALVSPTGLSGGVGRPATQQAARVEGSTQLHGILSFPLWGQGLFDLVATRRSIAYFLGKSFATVAPTSLIDYAYAASHQPGARHAPLSFLSGKLFTRDIAAQVYATLATPTVILYDKDPYVRFDGLADLLAANPAITAVRVPDTRGLPHWEKPAETFQALDHFWQTSRLFPE